MLETNILFKNNKFSNKLEVVVAIQERTTKCK